MRVMTFNIRFETEEDGFNGWVYRRELVTKLIRKYEPSILGTQEGMIQQLNFIQDELPEYQMYAPHRVSDAMTQYPTLYFRKNQLDVLEGEEFWLSKTPRSHRSKDWDSAFPRMISCVRVRSKGFANSIWVAVTHLDHMGEIARYEQAKIITRWLRDLSSPVILMGDFNDRPDSDVHRLLTSPNTGLKDTWQLLGNEEGASSFTHHDFHGAPRKTRMDWILASPEFRTTHAQIVRDHRGESYPSDHFPYIVDIELSDQ